MRNVEREKHIEHWGESQIWAHCRDLKALLFGPLGGSRGLVEQEVGVRIRESYNAGRKVERDLRQQQGIDHTDALFTLDFLICPEKFAKYATPEMRATVERVIDTYKNDNRK